MCIVLFMRPTEIDPQNQNNQMNAIETFSANNFSGCITLFGCIYVSQFNLPGVHIHSELSSHIKCEMRLSIKCQLLFCPALNIEWATQ